MATFWKKVKNKYPITSFQDAKNTYDWIIKTISKGNFEHSSIRTEFLFDASGMLCNCESIDEFVENAYNQDGFHLTHLSVSFRPKDSGFVSITAECGNVLSISTKSRVMMEKIETLLNSTTLDETEVNNPIMVTYVEQQINNDGVIIHGNGNTVANNHSEVEVEQQKEESGKKSFWEGILQNITSNLLWYLLTFGAGIVIAYLSNG